MKRKYIAPKIAVRRARITLLSQSSKLRDSLDLLSVSDLNQGNLYALNCHDVSKATCSDSRLKKNITNASVNTRNILTLRVVTYNWRKKALLIDNSLNMNSTYIGLLAQDVEKVFPEAVVKLKGTNFKGILYEKLAPPLITALQELKKENILLKKKLQNSHKS